MGNCFDLPARVRLLRLHWHEQPVGDLTPNKTRPTLQATGAYNGTVCRIRWVFMSLNQCSLSRAWNIVSLV